MSFYRTTFADCFFRMSFYRTTCENGNFQMSFYKTTCGHPVLRPLFTFFSYCAYPFVYTFFIRFFVLLYTLCTPRLYEMEGIFWKTIILFVCRSIERHLRIAIFACRSIERHASRTTFFQEMPFISLRRGVHKVYKDTK